MLGLGAADVVDTAQSARWAGATPTISIVVSTFRRPHYLAELFGALEAQDLERSRFEVVVVDNGSGDETWDVLRRLVATTPLAAQVGLVRQNRGPASGRNAAVDLARAPKLAFTDDDCFPERSWARVMAEALECHRIVQGRTLPDPRPARRDWDHTITVTAASGYFETCNLAYRRQDVIDAGGFEPLRGYRAGRGGFPFGGEDTLLGWKVVRATGEEPAFVADATVHHRIEPRTYREWLRMRSGMAIFPALVANVPELRHGLFLRCFLTRRTAEFDLAVVGVLAAILRRSPLLLAAALPYLRRRLPRSPRGLRGSLRRSARVAMGDVAAAMSLVQGSVRHRAVVL
jgi:hypothetical protein